MVDLDDTRKCVRAAACECCGDVRDLRVDVVMVVVRAFCLTRCEFCSAINELPEWDVAETLGASLGHCTHLGIDADTMAYYVQDARR